MSGFTPPTRPAEPKPAYFNKEELVMIPDVKLDEWEKKLRENPEGSQPNWEYRGILKETISDLRRCRELLNRSHFLLDLSDLKDCMHTDTEKKLMTQLLKEIREYRGGE